MPSIQATLSNQTRQRLSSPFTLQLSDTGGRSGTANALRFRLDAGYTGIAANDIRCGLAIYGTSIPGDPVAYANTVNPSSPSTGVVLTQFVFDGGNVGIDGAVNGRGVLAVYVGSNANLSGRTLTIELLTSAGEVLDAVVVPISNAPLTPRPLGLRPAPNEATALSNYVTSIADALEKLTNSQSGSIIVFPTEDSDPIRIQFTDPISLPAEFESRALSAAEISQPLALEITFRASVLTRAYADLLLSLERDGIARANAVPAKPPIFEIQIVGTRSTHVFRNCSLTFKGGFNFNAGDINSEENYLGGTFKCVLTSREFLLGFYEN